MMMMQAGEFYCRSFRRRNLGSRRLRSFRPGKKLGRGTFFLDRPQWQQRGCNRFEAVASPETTSRWDDVSLVFRTLLFSGLSS